MASNQPHVADFDFDEGGAVGLSVLFLGVRRRNRDLRNTWHFPLPVLLPAKRPLASRWVLVRDPAGLPLVAVLPLRQSESALTDYRCLPFTGFCHFFEPSNSYPLGCVRSFSYP